MVDSVGVGGLTTGGGIGNQIGERGMTLDTLVAVGRVPSTPSAWGIEFPERIRLQLWSRMATS